MVVILFQILECSLLSQDNNYRTTRKLAYTSQPLENTNQQLHEVSIIADWFGLLDPNLPVLVRTLEWKVSCKIKIKKGHKHTTFSFFLKGSRKIVSDSVFFFKVQLAVLGWEKKELLKFYIWNKDTEALLHKPSYFSTLLQYLGIWFIHN